MYNISFNEKNILNPFVFKHDVLLTENNCYIPNHYHDEIELLYMTSGDLFVETINKSFILKTGEVLFVNSRVVHRTKPIDHAVMYDMLQFDISKYITLPYSKLINPCRFASTDNNILIFDSLKNPKPELTQIMQKIHTEILNDMSITELIINSSIFEIIYFLYKYDIFKTSTSLYDSDEYKKITPVLKFIDTHFSENITLDDLCKLVNFNKSYLCRLFKNITSFSIIDYLNTVRIDRAKQLLTAQTGTYSIAEISTKVGFSSISYFNKVFNKLVGTSPSKYKKIKYKQI